MGSIKNTTLEASDFRNSPVYYKALEIFKVSRAIACSISDNSNILEMRISSNPSHRYAEEIVGDSLKLVPQLAVVQNTKSPSLRQRRAKRIRSVSRNLLQKCKKLEFSNSKEREFLVLLNSEIKQFEVIFAEWFYNLQINNRKN